MSTVETRIASVRLRPRRARSVELRSTHRGHVAAPIAEISGREQPATRHVSFGQSNKIKAMKVATDFLKSNAVTSSEFASILEVSLADVHACLLGM